MVGRFACALICSLILGSASTIALGSMTITGPDELLAAKSAAGGNSTLTWSSTPLTGPSQSDLDVLRTAFPTWTFEAGGQLNGELDITDFEATASATKGGADIVIGYYLGQGDPDLANLEWIQIVSTSDPLPGKSNPSVDNQASPDYEGPPLPFYYSPDEDSTKKSHGINGQGPEVYGFADYPSRFWPDPPQPPNINSKTWHADLLLASWSGSLDDDGNGAVTIYGGLGWGFYLAEYPGGGGGGGGGGGFDASGTPTVLSVPEPGGLLLLALGAGLVLPWGLCRWSPQTWWQRSRPIVASSLTAATLTVLAVLGTMHRAAGGPTPTESRTCRLKFKLPRKSFELGESIPMNLEFVNESGREFTIWECGFCLNHRLEVEDEQGRKAPLTEMGEKCQQRFSPGGPRDRNYPVHLAPGDSYRRPSVPSLGYYFHLEPGAYRARVTYEDGEDETYLKRASNWVHFRIRP